MDVESNVILNYLYNVISTDNVTRIKQKITLFLSAGEKHKDNEVIVASSIVFKRICILKGIFAFPWFQIA